jgi:hypothetical protein
VGLADRFQDAPDVRAGGAGHPAGGGRLDTSAVGEIELEGHTLVIKRIAVTYRLAMDQNATMR